jgi:large conductance mechanosensitive channel
MIRTPVSKVCPSRDKKICPWRDKSRISGLDMTMLKEFRDFIARGNVIDLAVGIIMGAAFGKIVTTFVESIVMPPIGVLTGRVDFSSLFVVLDESKGVPASLADAKTRGIPVIAYGQFINDLIGFLIVGFAVFLLVKQVNRIKGALEQPPPGPATRECPFCASNISIKAKRCPQCTSDLMGAAAGR